MWKIGSQIPHSLGKMFPPDKNNQRPGDEGDEVGPSLPAVLQVWRVAKSTQNGMIGQELFSQSWVIMRWLTDGLLQT